MGILDSLENSPHSSGARAARGRRASGCVERGSRQWQPGRVECNRCQLRQAGFGDQVRSWIGDGQNVPITAEQLQQVLGSDVVRQLAARFNIPVDQLSQVLAQALPTDGTLPASS
jgi:uncharacterized protein YidB (DUF937 family)